MKKKLLAALLAALLLLSTAPSALAEDAAVRKIADERQFAAFLDACARESYSKDKRFVLLNDLDLSKVACAPAPYFAGELDGGGHTIRGLAFAPTGSRQGLFRQLGEGAAIRNLTVEGSVLPDGTREDIGGLVGLNEGTVENCAFSGEVRGVNNVGGLVGRNRGAVTNCRFVGTVCGEHQVGGLVGRNEGVVQKSETDAAVNAEEITPSGEKRFDLATLSQDDFTDLVNIGGVAGENTGVLSACTAAGSVGWHYTGYNVGGVVGKNSGYVDGCVNTASVEGRRDVGGVVGQSLPYAAWELSEGKLQELSRAIGGLSYQLAVMTQKFSDATDETIETLSGMRGDSENAMSAVKALLRDSADRTASFLDGVSVDPDTGELILPPGGLGPADTTALTSALGSLFAHVRALSGALDGTVGETAEDIKKLAGQVSYIFNLLFAVVSDVSSGDLISRRDLSCDEAYDHNEGAIAQCENRGAVRAETCAGGVVGTVAFELSFDMEDQLAGSDFLPTQAEQLLFAAVRGCENSGAVSARGDRAGGVVGRMDMGAVVDCVSRGAVSSQTGDYVGGVAGETQGTLARCWARAELSGGKYVGGAAGSGKDIRDCRTMAHVAGADEYAGAIAGWATGEVSGNLYAESRPEGVDGVSRIGQSEAVTAKALQALDGAPRDFASVSVRFLGEDDALLEERTLPFGALVKDPPAVASRNGAAWVWDSFPTEGVYADCELHGAYLARVSTISSDEEPPLFLVEGDFFSGQRLTAEPYDRAPAEGESLGGWTLRVEDYTGELTVRMRSESGAKILLPEGDGWVEAQSRWDGRYLVFPLENGGSFAVVAEAESHSPLLLTAFAAAGVLALLLLVRGLVRRRKRKKAAAPAETAASAPAESADKEKT